jgi:hypothetical protein
VTREQAHIAPFEAIQNGPNGKAGGKDFQWFPIWLKIARGAQNKTFVIDAIEATKINT